MPPKPQGLTKRGTRYYYRRAVPERLQPVFILPEHLSDEEAHPYVALLALLATKFGEPEWVSTLLDEYRLSGETP